MLVRTRLCLAVVCSAALVLIAAGAGAAGASGGCGLPLVHDPYDGYHVGVPSGWSLSATGGALLVSRDSSGTVEAIVFPAILTTGLTPSGVFSSLSSQLSRAAAAGRNQLAFHVTGTGAGLVSATVSGRSGSVAVAGGAGVRLINELTPSGTKVAIFSAYWAPAAGLGALRSTLAAIGVCYGPERGVPILIAHDQQFTYPLPLGWTPNEQVNGLLVEDGTQGEAVYAFYGPLTAADGVTDDRSLLAYLLRNIRVRVARVLGVAETRFPDGTGRLSEDEHVEFLATSPSGVPEHAYATVIASSGSGITAGVVRLALAKASAWAPLGGVLIEIANAIQHSFTQDLHMIAAVQRQLGQFDEQFAGFDAAINNEALTVDPATGQGYDVPLSSYMDGPDGPGYYGPNGQKLQLVG